MTSDILTLEEAARLLKVKPATMRLYARTRIVPGVKVGKSWRFNANDIPCSTSVLQSQGHTGGSGSPSKARKYGSRVAQIARTVRKRLNSN